MKKEMFIDVEPKWVDLVDFLIDIVDHDTAKKEIRKMAIIADKVRQAQKKKERLVFDFREKKKLKKVI